MTAPLDVIAQTHNLWGDHHAVERAEALGDCMSEEPRICSRLKRPERGHATCSMR